MNKNNFNKNSNFYILPMYDPQFFEINEIIEEN